MGIPFNIVAHPYIYVYIIHIRNIEVVKINPQGQKQWEMASRSSVSGVGS